MPYRSDRPGRAARDPAAPSVEEDPVTGRWHQPQPGDLYQVLGVSPDASRAEIIRAYRFKARAAHPDTHPADPQAAAREEGDDDPGQ